MTEDWRSLKRKCVHVTSTSAKDLIQTRMETEHAQRAEAGQLSRRFQSIQPTLNPIRERTVRPVIRDDASTVQDERKTSRFHEIDVNSFRSELVSSENGETRY